MADSDIAFVHKLTERADKAEKMSIRHLESARSEGYPDPRIVPILETDILVQRELKSTLASLLEAKDAAEEDRVLSRIARLRDQIVATRDQMVAVVNDWKDRLSDA
jgi:hypothetical protein